MYKKKHGKITFSVPIKIECDNGKTTAYKLRFIDSFRFMSASLSDLADNMSNNRCKKMQKVPKNNGRNNSKVFKRMSIL